MGNGSRTGALFSVSVDVGLTPLRYGFPTPLLFRAAGNWGGKNLSERNYYSLPHFQEAPLWPGRYRFEPTKPEPPPAHAIAFHQLDLILMGDV